LTNKVSVEPKKISRTLPIWLQILTNVQAKRNRCCRARYVAILSATDRHGRDHDAAGHVLTGRHEGIVV
jgi:hypothetical protein